MDKQEQLIKLAQQSSNSKDFNQIMKQLQQLQKEQDSHNQKQKVTQKLENLMGQIVQQSNNTAATIPLVKLIGQLGPLMNDIESLKESIKDSDSMTLYMQYRSIILSFQDNEKFCEQVSKESMNAACNPQKMEEIKNRIFNLLEKIKVLHNSAQKHTQKYLLWMDKKSFNNKNTLAAIQEQYSGMVLVQYYDNDDEFRKDVMQYRDQPCVILMSGAAAGPNTQWGDGDHFNFLKKNQASLRIMGSVIYCGEQGYNNLKHLLNDSSKLIKFITTKEGELRDYIDKLLIPTDYKRIVLLEHIDFFIPGLKKQLINIGLTDFSNYDLRLLNPQKKNMQQKFANAKNIIIKKKVSLTQEVIDNIVNIPAEVQKCFDNNSTVQDIARSILKLYSTENTKIPVYNFLNASLNILNEELIFELNEFYHIFILSLFHFDDRNITVISPDGSPTLLYRGSSIDEDHFQQFIKIGEQIVMPSFCSYSTKKESAIQFMAMNGKFANTRYVLFELSYKTGNQFFPNRPKNISSVSVFPNEDEYIVYPFSCFKIQSVTKFKAFDTDAYLIRITS